MPRRIDPMREGRIFRARQKKAAQLRGTARISYAKGVQDALKAASELTQEGYSETYELESIVLHRLKVIDTDHRILRGSDTTASLKQLFDTAKALLKSEKPLVDDFISAAVSQARSANEAWVLHRELTEISSGELPPKRRAKLAAAISLRFPD